MKIKIANDRADEDSIYLLLTGDDITGLTGIEALKSVKLSDFKSSNPSMEINMTTIKSGRLYVGYGAFPEDGNPVPESDQYYGWIELTKTASDTGVWINLSNVDLTGLPIALAGTDTDNKAFTLGYKNPMTSIISSLQDNALLQPIDTNAANITCATGQTKILGPNKSPDSYPSYTSYIEELSSNSAPLSITSDTPKDAPAITFTGSFLDAQTDNDPIISIQNEDGSKKIQVLKSQFTSNICYECDGGTLIFNGTTVPQNQSPQNTNDKLYCNSTFRNILIGINEGYFTKSGPNNSEDFPGDIPFGTGDGSQYAKVIHENSNSYGFPYADSNLKVLIQGDPSKEITMTICKDTEAKGYDNNEDKTPNQPTSGTFQFGIGAGSAELGMITIGNWRYPATDEGAYGGYLPTLTSWTKMHFSGPDTYIWIKTTGDGSVSADGCFNSTPFFNKIKDTEIVLTWGADVKWNDGVPSPAEPSEEVVA